MCFFGQLSGDQITLRPKPDKIIEVTMASYADRPHGLGSSDAPAACGVSPWKTPWQLCLEKIGRLDQQPMNEAMKLGILLEPVVAQLYSEATGHALSEAPIVKHPEIEWAFASPDRIRDDGELVEIKTTNAWASGWGEQGTDEIPEHYLVQVAHQLACTGREVCDVAVLIGGQEFRTYTIRRNERLIETVLRLERAFWRHVEDGLPPSPDYSRAECQRVIAEMHGANGTEIALPDQRHYVVAQEYLSAKEHEKHFKQLAETAKAELIDAMAGAGKAVLMDGTTITRKQITRKSYEVAETTYCNFNVKRPKRKDGQR